MDLKEQTKSVGHAEFIQPVRFPVVHFSAGAEAPVMRYHTLREANKYWQVLGLHRLLASLALVLLCFHILETPVQRVEK